MIPHITRGGDTRGVIAYLVGKGRREEHVDPHLVAGSAEAVLRAAGRLLERRDVGPLAGFLDEPREGFGTAVTIAERDQDGTEVGRRDAHVWHCSLALHPDEPALSDARWGELADRFVAEMRFAGDDVASPCRWVAVRHGLSTGGSDHVHVVVVLVAEDGSKASVHNDRLRAQAACRSLEREFGLREIEARSRGAGERAIEPGELEGDLRRGLDVGEGRERPERGSRRMLERVVRACGAAARDEPEFVARLRDERLLVRPRYASGSTSEVVGYSVAERPTRKGQAPVWYGGGRLSRELTLPRLRENWPETGTAAAAEAGKLRLHAAAAREPPGREGRRRARCRSAARASSPRCASSWWRSRPMTPRPGLIPRVRRPACSRHGPCGQNPFRGRWRRPRGSWPAQRSCVVARSAGGGGARSLPRGTHKRAAARRGPGGARGTLDLPAAGRPLHGDRGDASGGRRA